MGKKQKDKSKDDVDLLAKARKQFSKLHTDDNHNRLRAEQNIEFAYDIGPGQWPADIKDERKDDGRPCLTSNKLRKFVAQVVNSERDQRIAGNVLPVDDEGDVFLAEVMADLIRQIEHASDAERAYTLAGEQAVAGNEGFVRIIAKELPNSFDQELFIEEVRNQFAVHLDPDGMFGFVTEKIRKEDFKAMWPNAIVEGPDTTLENADMWYSEDDIFVREYYHKERVRTTIVQASRQTDASGQLEAESKIFELGKDISEKDFKAQGWVIDKRPDGTELKKTPEVFKVKWEKITATQVLERSEWLGEDIPIIPCEGDWHWLKGRLYKHGLIDGAKDDQRMYNYWISSITERYGLAAKAPYLVTQKMIGQLKSFWDTAHKKLMPYLPYVHDKRQPHGPRREIPPQIATGETQMLAITAQNLEDSIGIFKAGFGQASNERSKVAIDARASRSQLSVFHFPDNYKRFITQVVKQLIDLIPKYYDTERVVRLRNEKGDIRRVQINYTVKDEEGNDVKKNDLSVGKYDVVESVKLMSTRRQEMVQGMREFAAGNPAVAAVLLPRIAKAMDWEGHEEIAAEMKEILPMILGVNPQGNAESELTA